MKFGLFSLVTVLLSLVSAGTICAILNIGKLKGHGLIACLPQGWKQWICCAAVLVSMFCLQCMYLMYYKTSELSLLKREVLLGMLWPLAVSDVKEMRIPNKILLVGLAARVLIIPVEYLTLRIELQAVLINEAIAFAFSFVITIACVLVSKGSLGMGDVKLICIMALFLGTEGLLYASFLSILIAFFAAIGLLMFKKKKRTDTVPFAPFILAGTFLSFILSGT